MQKEEQLLQTKDVPFSEGEGAARRSRSVRQKEQEREREKEFQNPELPALQVELAQRCSSQQADPFLLHLYGVVLKHVGQKERAMEVLVRSVHGYPLNWSAWKLLATLCNDTQTLSKLSLPVHWVRDLFFAEVLLELQQPVSQQAQLFNILTNLQTTFPQSTHVLMCTATAHYNLRQYEQAQQIFEELRELDPYRVEGLDLYSNILYVKEAKTALSYLAHQAFAFNKYRSETCCIVGNYYSLKGQHAKAIVYFQRAVRLNPQYLSAFTLMGHEYVELRNTAAAIQAYRTAVDINPKDFRAWYGLGQTYEMLQMYSYALYYFSKAAALRPYDPRMWCGMAESYEKVGKVEEAIKCYLRAEAHQGSSGTPDTLPLLKLATLYAQLGGTHNRHKAAEYYSLLLQRHGGSRWVDGSEDGEGGVGVEGEGGVGVPAEAGPNTRDTNDCVEARMYLAEYLKSEGRLKEAAHHCLALLQLPLPPTSTQPAKVLLAEIRMLQTLEAPSESPNSRTTPT